jgi:hypothetical protein
MALKCRYLNFCCPDPAAQISELVNDDWRKDDESVPPDNRSQVDEECKNPAFCEKSANVAADLGLLFNQF